MTKTKKDAAAQQQQALQDSLSSIIDDLSRQEAAYEAAARHFDSEGESTTAAKILRAVETMGQVREKFVASWQRIFQRGERTDHFPGLFSTAERPKVTTLAARFLRDSEELKPTAVAYLAAKEEEMSLAIEQLSSDLQSAANALMAMERRERRADRSHLARPAEGATDRDRTLPVRGGLLDRHPAYEEIDVVPEPESFQTWRRGQNAMTAAERRLGSTRLATARQLLDESMLVTG